MNNYKLKNTRQWKNTETMQQIVLAYILPAAARCWYGSNNPLILKIWNGPIDCKRKNDAVGIFYHEDIAEL